MDTPSTIDLSPLVVTLVISLIVPIATGLVTKYTLPAAAKAVIMVVLDGAVALITQAVMLPDGTAVINTQALLAFILAVVVSVGTYLGVYVPVKLSNRPDGVLAPTLGVGPKPSST